MPTPLEKIIDKPVTTTPNPNRHRQSTLLHYRPQSNPGCSSSHQLINQKLASQSDYLHLLYSTPCPDYEEALKSLNQKQLYQHNLMEKFHSESACKQPRRSSLNEKQFSQRYRSHSGHNSCPSPKTKSSFIPLPGSLASLQDAINTVSFDQDFVHDFSKQSKSSCHEIQEDLPLDLTHPSKRQKTDFVICKDGILDFSSKTRKAVQEMNYKTKPQQFLSSNSTLSSNLPRSNTSQPMRSSFRPADDCKNTNRLQPNLYQSRSLLYRERQFGQTQSHASRQNQIPPQNQLHCKQNENKSSFMLNAHESINQKRPLIKEKFVEALPTSSQTPVNTRYLSDMNQETIPSLNDTNFDEIMMSRCISKAKDALLSKIDSSQPRSSYHRPPQNAIAQSSHSSHPVFYCREVNYSSTSTNGIYNEKPIQYLNTTKDDDGTSG